MPYFFDDEDKLARLRAEIKTWEDTPYKHWTGVRGKGCDCIHFIVRAMEPIGAFKGKYIHIPKYPPDWHLHHGHSLLVDGIREQMDVTEVDREKPQDGDVILYEFGLHEAHGGIYMDGRVWQALTDIGVQPRDYEDRFFFNRMKRAFRFNK